jgi:hypothetical protein
MKKILLGAAAAIMAVSAQANVVINEIMQSNVDCYFLDHEFPDSWVELYNPSSSSVSVSQWKIGLSENVSEAWNIAVSGLKIPAKGYLLIFCDKVGNGLHTDFRLDSGKSSVYLFDASGNVVDNISFKKQPAPNIAYGRTTDGGSTWAYFISATPGKTNVGTTIKSNSTVMPAPIFSHDSFVSVAGKDSFTLTVSVPSSAPSDTKLCVTTDGREPTTDDVVNGTEWTKQISTNTVVRAKLISTQALPIRSTVRSYIYHPEATSLPVFSIVGDPDYFYSDAEGILMGEWDDNDATKQNPNWNHDWRRPVNVEYMSGEKHTEVINQLGETRIQGGWSRRNAQKSLALYANKRFGTKRFEGVKWRDKPNVTEVKSFILRNGGNGFDAARIHDQLGQTIIGRNSSNLDWQAYEPAIYYINGKYMGLTDVRERSNEDYVLANYGLEDIDVIENWTDLKEGTISEFNKFVSFYNTSGITLEQLKTQMDVDNFLDMFVIKAFGNDTDFPNNNIECWRQQVETGKWRWILKDIDRIGIQWMSGQINDDYCTFVENLINSAGSSKKYYNLFKLFYSTIPEAYELFIDRMAIYMGDFLQTSYAQGLIDEMIAEIQPEYLRHLNVYYPDVTSTNHWRYKDTWGWQGYTKYMRDTWWETRRTNVYNHLRTRYSLGKLIALKIARDGASVSFNDINLALDDFDGKWYAGRTIKLKTDESHGFKVTEYNSFYQKTENTYNTSTLQYTPSSYLSSIAIEVVERESGVDDVNADNSLITIVQNGNSVDVASAAGLESVDVYTLDGRLVASMSHLGGQSSVTVDDILSANVYVIKVVTSAGTTQVQKFLAE